MSQDRPDLRTAYREAWAARVETGDTSDAVLLRRLHLHGLFVDPENPGGLPLVLGFWRRGVSPRQLPWEVAKEGARTLRTLGRAYWAIAENFRGSDREQPDDEDPESGPDTDPGAVEGHLEDDDA